MFPSQSLGIAVSPADLATGYSTLVNGGTYHPQRYITDVEVGVSGPRDNNGTEVQLPALAPSQRVISTSVSAQVVQAMRQVVTNGTAQPTLGQLPFTLTDIVGKTGTTEKENNAWFVGCRPTLCLAIWMGYPFQYKNGEPNSMNGVEGVLGTLRRHAAGQDLRHDLHRLSGEPEAVRPACAHPYAAGDPLERPRRLCATPGLDRTQEHGLGKGQRQGIAQRQGVPQGQSDAGQDLGPAYRVDQSDPHSATPHDGDGTDPRRLGGRAHGASDGPGIIGGGLGHPVTGAPVCGRLADVSANVVDLLAGNAARTPDATALIFEGSVVSWGELAAGAARVSAGLRSLGLQDGDRVVIVLGNVPDFPLAYFGVLGAGLVAVPMNPTLTDQERTHVLQDSGAGALIGPAADAARLKSVAGEGTHVILTGSSVGGLTGLGAGLPAVERRGGGEDLAVIVYTSGTSGRPRGAMLTHRALLANLEQSAAVEPPLVEAGDIVLLVLPLFHIYGLNAGLGLALRNGAASVLAERFDPVDSLQLIARHGVTVVVGAPPMYVAWSMLPDAERAFATVRLAISGAAPLAASILTRMLGATGHHVFEGYGLTETAPVLTTTLMSEVAKPGSIGKPLPGIELRLADAGDLVDASEDEFPGEVGIIEVRGANLFNGYWPDGQGGPDVDGWWSTGDVAFADDDGDLHLVDRARELILVSGFNVYPREVEDVLDAHPEIRESAVLGVPHPYTGQSVKAIIVRVAGSSLTSEEVIAWAASSLARFKCPTSVEFLDKLPHTSTGKISKGMLRERVQEPGS